MAGLRAPERPDHLSPDRHLPHGRDPDAVTDSRLRVNGLDGLRVVDASVMPRMVSGNTQAAVMMVAERGAELILEDAARAG